MLHRVAQFVAQRLIKTNSTVLVAVSGGADSLCLLHVLVALREHLGINLHVAHLDHMMRAGESAADAAFVRATAQAWGLPVSVEALDVAAYATKQRLNLHDAARQVRYAWLQQRAVEIGAHAIAVAHSANDQAETVLMHLLRGAGTEGLSGMPAVQRYSESPHASASTVVPLIRPLLHTTRTEIEAYCAEHGLAPRQDETNFDQAYTRNRIRHELLPLLATYNPRILEALGRTAAISTDAETVVQAVLDKAWPELAHTYPGGITFQGAAWQNLAPALQRAALRRAYTLLGGIETLAWEHVEQARTLAETQVGKHMPLPGGIRLEVGYRGALLLGAVVHSGPQLDHAQIEIDIPGCVQLADGWTIQTGTGAPPVYNHWCIALDSDALALPLFARTRQPGDRMRPHGGRGSRSLQNMFVDAKVPRVLRERWPVIIDKERIVWLPGVRAAEGCVATPNTPQAIWIQIVAPERN